MKDALEPYLIGIECFVFIVAVSFLLLVSGIYTKTEKNINKEIHKKNDVSSTYTDYEKTELRQINGATILSEITMYDGTVPVKINATMLNDIRTETGEPFFEYIKEYGTSILNNEVSITATYEKTCYLDSNGHLTLVQYQLVS